MSLFLHRRSRFLGVLAGLLLTVAFTGYTLPAPAISYAQSLRASGDIPDSAVYLTYHASSFSLKYVEGWGIQTLPRQTVRINDKDSTELVTISHAGGSVTTLAATELARFKHTLPQFHLLVRHTVRLQPGMAMYLQYRTLSDQDPVTGKRVPVLVDRYYVPGRGRKAIVTLSTPLGVDNVDAFHLIARSFRWK